MSSFFFLFLFWGNPMKASRLVRKVGPVRKGQLCSREREREREMSSSARFVGPKPKADALVTVRLVVAMSFVWSSAQGRAYRPPWYQRWKE